AQGNPGRHRQLQKRPGLNAAAARRSGVPAPPLQKPASKRAGRFFRLWPVRLDLDAQCLDFRSNRPQALVGKALAAIKK
ncbi:hypothetical protein, partial [Acidovorax sp. SRB_24]|uniref:hypothetical protein n=1 Tax=Acidovorax sp. SRB_24 TaxID=1962700 RepID=UPI00197B3A77